MYNFKKNFLTNRYIAKKNLFYQIKNLFYCNTLSISTLFLITCKFQVPKHYEWKTEMREAQNSFKEKNCTKFNKNEINLFFF